MARPRNEELYVGGEKTGEAISQQSLGEHKAVEPVTDEQAAKTAIEKEAFMNEPVRIIVAETGEEGSLQVITPCVNGVNQPIVRGQETVVKRKFVEALARCRTTKYQQRHHPIERDKIENVPITVQTYPFSVLEDRNPKGRAWLQGIVAER